MEDRNESEQTAETPMNPALKRMGEVLLFVGLILLSSLAVIAVAVAAPFVLLLSYVAGVFSKGRETRAWRSLAA